MSENDAPQPAPAPADEREALVEVIRNAFLDFGASGGRLRSGAVEFVADALLARGLRLPGEETMAWSVVNLNGNVMVDTVREWRAEAEEEVAPTANERVVRVAIRVVEGGDDAA